MSDPNSKGAAPVDSAQEFFLARQEAEQLTIRRRLREERERLANEIKDDEIRLPTPEEIEERHLRRMAERNLDTTPCAKLFLADVLNDFLPSHRKQLIYMAAATGNGKSTILANIAHAIWKQGLKILIISNEEGEDTVYARIMQIETGLPVKHFIEGKATPEQQELEFNLVSQLKKHVTVLEQGSFKQKNLLTSVDGIQKIFETVDMSGFAVVALDYYQKIVEHTKAPGKSVNDVQQMLSAFLDRQREVLKCPIIVMGQQKSENKNDKLSFEERMKGRKTILEVCSEAVEMVANRAEYSTKWILHKDRFGGGKFTQIVTGFDRDHAKYVGVSDEYFRQRVVAWKEERAAASVAAGVSEADEGSDEA